jgi:hypothetical protein
MVVVTDKDMVTMKNAGLLLKLVMVIVTRNWYCNDIVTMKISFYPLKLVRVTGNGGDIVTMKLPVYS